MAVRKLSDLNTPQSYNRAEETNLLYDDDLFEVSLSDALGTGKYASSKVTFEQLSNEISKRIPTLPIGTILYTSRDDLPGGCLYADGSEYSEALWPEFYKMIVDGDLPSINFNEWNSLYNSSNGNVGKYGLDAVNHKFKMISLNDSYIKSVLDSSETSNLYQTQGLPNIIGRLDGLNYYTGSTKGMQDAFYWGKTNINDGSYYRNLSLNFRTTGRYAYFDASLSNSIYGSSIDVIPESVRFKAIVLVYSSIQDVSSLSASALIDAISNKANITLDNLSNIELSSATLSTNEISSMTSVEEISGLNGSLGRKISYPDVVIESWFANDMKSWYRKYQSGWIEQGGVGTVDSWAQKTETITLPIQFSNNKYNVLLTYRANTYASSGTMSIYDKEEDKIVSSFVIQYDFNGTAGTQPSGSAYWYACGF